MYFCTYFDSKYITKATVCHRTLMASGCRELFALCLDPVAVETASSWKSTTVVTLNQIEAYRPCLLTIKGKRLPKEYYATITPTFPQFLFESFKLDTLFYTDADMAFMSPVDEIVDTMGSFSLLVTPHENPLALAGGAGYFNVGILGYRNDANCKEFLKWWEARCLEWCEWRALPDGRCADQGYLNVFRDQPNLFKGVLESKHPGINLGPWNLAMHSTGKTSDGKIVLDGSHNLVSYHFHGYKNIDGKCVNDTGWEVSAWNMEHIYRPYHDLVVCAQKGGLG